MASISTDLDAVIEMFNVTPVFGADNKLVVEWKTNIGENFFGVRVNVKIEEFSESPALTVAYDNDLYGGFGCIFGRHAIPMNAEKNYKIYLKVFNQLADGLEVQTHFLSKSYVRPPQGYQYWSIGQMQQLMAKAIEFTVNEGTLGFVPVKCLSRCHSVAYWANVDADNFMPAFPRTDADGHPTRLNYSFPGFFSLLFVSGTLFGKPVHLAQLQSYFNDHLPKLDMATNAFLRIVEDANGTSSLVMLKTFSVWIDLFITEVFFGPKIQNAPEDVVEKSSHTRSNSSTELFGLFISQNVAKVIANKSRLGGNEWCRRWPLRRWAIDGNVKVKKVISPIKKDDDDFCGRIRSKTYFA